MKNKTWVCFFLMLLFFSPSVLARLNNKQYHDPKFPGGCDKLNLYIAKNVHYLDMAREAAIQGQVIARFLIDEKGKIRDIEIIRGIGGGCDQEVIRIIKNMPKWVPAYYNHRPVRSIYDLPVIFKLE